MTSKPKRFRQLGLKESFNFSKKPKIEHLISSVPTMDENLRNLLAATAEKRMLENIKSQIVNEEQKNGPTGSTSVANTKESELNTCTENVPPSQPENIDFPNSIDLFPSLSESLPDSPIVEQCSSQETNQPDNIDSQSSSYSNSAELFVEEYDDSESQDQNESDDESVQLSYLKKRPYCNMSLPDLEPLENHSIMFSPHIRPGDAPRPYPAAYHDKWDSDHVRMPCSPQSKFPWESPAGKVIKSRWDLICKSLRRNIQNSKDLEDAIMVYNFQYKDKWNFNGLHSFFDFCFTEDERTHFFENILPAMINMALDLPYICTQPIPLLRKNKDHSITMSQKQIGCLLLNAFFSTFPRRNLARSRRFPRINHEYSSFPDINFHRLFYGVRNRLSTRTEKLKCIFNYFRRILEKEPCGTVTFHRQHLSELPCWAKSVKGFKTAVIESKGLIETEGQGMLQVDFANKFVGGGVLGNGCVQEEIRFIICPELIVSRLFVECLDPKEALIVTGIEQFNKYSGYSDTFTWEGSYIDHTERDAWGRRYTQIVAIDATPFTNCSDQFKSVSILRELTKAYCGFYEDAFPEYLPAIATGNWGCGAFKGDPNLKFLIQLMAASQANRDILYFTFGNKSLKRNLKRMYELLVARNISVGDLWRLLITYCSSVIVKKNGIHPKLIDYLFSMLSISDNNETKTNECITDSCEEAMLKLCEQVEEDSNTETEDNCTNK